MYLTTTKLGIMHVVNIINRYMEHPIEFHLGVTKRIFCYLKETIDYIVLYSKE
jgi:hypothetical protein